MKNINAILFCIGALFLTGCTIDIDRIYFQKVADCTTDNLDFQISVPNGQVYSFAFVLELYKMEDFSGEMVVTQSSGIPAHLSINSQNTSGWFCSGGTNGTNLSGYYLVEPKQLSHILVRGQTYNIHVNFSKRPPEKCHLWFISMP